MHEIPSGCHTYPSELPTSRGLKEIPIGRPHPIRGCDAGPSAQNHLTGHELAVVFAQCTRKGLVSRIAGVGAGRPFPTIAEQLLQNHPASHCTMNPPGDEEISLRRWQPPCVTLL